MKYLGTYLGCNDTTAMNFEHVLSKACLIANRWKKCNLILPAWVTVIKTFTFSIFVHVLNVVEVTSSQIDTIQKILNDFLWRGHSRIKFASVSAERSLGGLKMLNVTNVIHRLQVKWLKVEKLVPVELISGLHALSESQISCLPLFYAAMFRSYAHINNLFYESAKSEKLPMNIWGTVGQMKIRYDWCDAGFFTLADLPLSDGKIDFHAILDWLGHGKSDTYLMCCKIQSQWGKYLPAEAFPFNGNFENLIQ